MHPRNARIVRPLLGCRRSELRAYLAERRVGHVEDETNADVSIPRNRVRAELLPLLEDRFNPAIVDVLADEAELARETWHWIASAAADLFERAARRRTIDGSIVCELEVEMLNAAAAVERRVVVWRAMNEVAERRTISFLHVEAVLGLLENGRARSIHGPGLHAQRERHAIVLTGRPAGVVGRWSPPPRKRRRRKTRRLG